jgi:hypothetical protein
MANQWIIHLKGVRKDNPTLSYKQCMQKGKLSYKKQKGQGALSDAIGSLWKGIKKVGKGVAVVSIGIPLAVLGSEALLVGYLKSQPDGGTATINKGMEFLSKQ